MPAAILAIVSAAAAFVSLAGLHVLSPEYSPAWRLVSEYANGRYAWVLSLMFGAYGWSSLSLAFAVRSQLRSRRGKIGLAALVIAGIGQVAAAVFDLNQAALHDIAGALGIIALPIGAVLISLALVRMLEWAGKRRQLLVAANLTWISVLLWVAGFPLMMATFINAQGALPSSPPRELPPGVIALVGWTDRLLILAAWAWIAIVAWNAIRVQRLSASTNAGRGSIADRRGLDNNVAGDN